MLENRLQASGITNVSVTQEAIKGNRLVADGVAGKQLQHRRQLQCADRFLK